MTVRPSFRLATLLVATIVTAWQAAAQDVVRVDLGYRSPASGPRPNFSPKGTQVPLADAAPGVPLPDGAVRPARRGVLKIGPTERSHVGILATADADHPEDLCRLYVDRNRNGLFTDDGAALAATPKQNEKTGAWWSSFSNIELSVPYDGAAGGEPYMVNAWAVRQGADVPDVMRFSVASWRGGTTRLRGVEALVAVMDANNDAVFDEHDTWSVLEASAPDAARKVLSSQEARATSRLMFVKGSDRELVVEFRGVSADGRVLTCAVVDRAVTKAEDRAPDDELAAERGRPRATEPFAWRFRFDEAAAEARRTGRRLIVDFWTTWCGPCRTMDEWVWTDAEVSALLRDGYVGVKVDGDVEKALVARLTVTGYPTVVVLDAEGKELRRFAGYRSSKDVLAFLSAPPVPARR